MANTVIAIKKSATPAAVPTTLANGELAINFADGIIYYKNVSGGIASITGGAGGSNFGTVNAGGTLLVSDTAGDVLDIRAGQNIIITGDAVNDRMTINADLTPANSWANAVGVAANAYALSIAGGGSVNVSTMGPTGNINGSLWWNSNLGRLFIYYTDGDSDQWVEASPSSGSIDVELLQSYTNVASDLAKLAFNQSNTAYTQANAAYTQANTAYTQANTKLTNTSVTLNGSLTTTGAVIDYKGDVRDIPATDRSSSMPYTITIADTGKMVLANGNTSSTANVFVPNSVFSTGNTVMITNISTNTVTITQNSGVTMFLAGTNLSGNRTLSGRGIATLICIGANNFIISGAGVN